MSSFAPDLTGKAAGRPVYRTGLGRQGAPKECQEAALTPIEANAFGLTLINKTNQSISCSFLSIPDRTPIEATTKGWWNIKNGESFTFNANNGALSYYCEGYDWQTHWTPGDTGWKVRACIRKRVGFTIFFANQSRACRGEHIFYVNFNLLDNPDGTIQLTP